ncbi:cyclase family protein [Allonocardiopsis opalescens]|uniref:Kynurenine formamidase n=1 Tax=Allonocardiopsis opalescens TaxID=1144618 RepID=A0A2T0Q1S2_9ACTN|nr:cyclase family protein [Allonocardiopsis opalescens]PRX97752.1 kynurenine formamidase [Allonocardiopsis opalescens]
MSAADDGPCEVLTEDRVEAWMASLSNWGRWGDDDQAGTLNLITDAKRAEAAALVRAGVAVSCAWPITTHDLGDGGRPPQRFVTSTGGGLPGSRVRAATDHLAMPVHGLSVTHLDALGHIMWDGRMYNGAPAESVTAHAGAAVNAVTAAAGGVLTRGVLLDLPAALGVPWLAGGTGAAPADLDAAEDRQGVRVGPGDAVLVRTGYGRWRRESGGNTPLPGGRPGLGAACAAWLRERDAALAGCDTGTEVLPPALDAVPAPFHALAVVAMGLWLLDCCQLEDLADTCRRLERWEFQLTLAPLPFEGATGSPVNPVACF